MEYDFESAFGNDTSITKDGIVTQAYDFESAFAAPVTHESVKKSSPFTRALRAVTGTSILEKVQTEQFKIGEHAGIVEGDSKKVREKKYADMFKRGAERSKLRDEEGRPIPIGKSPGDEGFVEDSERVRGLVAEREEEIAAEGVLRQLEGPITLAISGNFLAPVTMIKGIAVTGPLATTKMIAGFTALDLVFNYREWVDEHFPETNPMLKDAGEVADIFLKGVALGGAFKLEPGIKLKVRSFVKEAITNFKGAKAAKLEATELSAVLTSNKTTTAEKLELLDQLHIKYEQAELAVKQDKGVLVAAEDVVTVIEGELWNKAKHDLGVKEKLEPGEISEEAAYKYLNENREQLKKQYLEENKVIIDSDLTKDLFKPAGYDNTNASKFHEPASELANEIYNEQIVLRKGKGNNKVLLTGGGPGAGKTTATKQVLKGEDFPIVFDSSMSNTAGVSRRIDLAVKNGYEVEIAAVLRDPAEAWINGVLIRTARGDRHVNLGTFLDLTFKFPKSMVELHAKYGNNPKVKFTIVKSHVDINKIKQVEFSEVESFRKSLKENREKIEDEIIRRTNKAVKDGDISKELLPEIYGEEVHPSVTRGAKGSADKSKTKTIPSDEHKGVTPTTPEQAEKQIGKKIPKENTCGNCYGESQAYLEKVIESGEKDSKLVHGMVDGQGPLKGVTYDHSWVEVTKDIGGGHKEVFVHDASNGRADNPIIIPKELYYAIGNIKENTISRYSLNQARKQMLETEHFGPWDVADEYVYHSTGKKSMGMIEAGGLIPHEGQYGKGVYVGRSVGKTKGYGGPEEVVLRVKRDKLDKDFQEFPDQGWTGKNIDRKDIEFSLDNGKTWHKLTELEGVESVDKFVPKKPKPPVETVKPKEVKGDGEGQVRGLSKSIERTAVEEKLTEGFGDLPEYETVSMKVQAEKALKLLNDDYLLALDVAMGRKPAPKGIIPEALLLAVEDKAILEGDVALLRDLAINSGLTVEATTMGQRIRTLGERDPGSPVGAIKSVQKAREGKVTRKNTKKNIKKEVDSIKLEIKKAAPKKADWNSFIKSLEC